MGVVAVWGAEAGARHIVGADERGSLSAQAAAEPMSSTATASEDASRMSGLTLGSGAGTPESSSRAVSPLPRRAIPCPAPGQAVVRRRVRVTPAATVVASTQPIAVNPAETHLSAPSMCQRPLLPKSAIGTSRSTV